MKHFLFAMLSILLICSCNDAEKQAGKASKGDTLKTKVNDSSLSAITPPAPPALKVVAHLIYEDGTISKVDVLNDKSVALWNVIIGGGDAEKHTDKVQLTSSGSLDSLSVLVKNGKKIALNEKNVALSGDKIYQLTNTGCEEVIVDIQRNKVVQYHDTIPFRCGE